MPFVIQDVFFSSFLVDFLIGACLSRALLKSQKKSFETQVCITIFCGKIPVYFLQIFFEKESMLKYPKCLQVVLTRSCFRLLPLKFSKIINWGRCSEIEIVMLPERYLRDGLFTKMLSISVADLSFTLVGSVIFGVKLQLKRTQENYMCLFFYHNR